MPGDRDTDTEKAGEFSQHFADYSRRIQGAALTGERREIFIEAATTDPENRRAFLMSAIGSCETPQEAMSITAVATTLADDDDEAAMMLKAARWQLQQGAIAEAPEFRILDQGTPEQIIATLRDRYPEAVAEAATARLQAAGKDDTPDAKPDGEYAERMLAAETQDERRKLFIEAAVAVGPEERDNVLLRAMSSATSVKEATEVMAAAFLVANSHEERIEMCHAITATGYHTKELRELRHITECGGSDEIIEVLTERYPAVVAEVALARGNAEARKDDVPDQKPAEFRVGDGSVWLGDIEYRYAGDSAEVANFILAFERLALHEKVTTLKQIGLEDETDNLPEDILPATIELDRRLIARCVDQARGRGREEVASMLPDLTHHEVSKKVAEYLCNMFEADSAEKRRKILIESILPAIKSNDRMMLLHATMAEASDADEQWEIAAIGMELARDPFERERVHALLHHFQPATTSERLFQKVLHGTADQVFEILKEMHPEVIAEADEGREEYLAARPRRSTGGYDDSV